MQRQRLKEGGKGYAVIEIRGVQREKFRAGLRG